MLVTQGFGVFEATRNLVQVEKWQSLSYASSLFMDRKAIG